MVVGGGGGGRERERQTDKQTHRQRHREKYSKEAKINLQHPIPKSNKQITKHEPHIEMILK